MAELSCKTSSAGPAFQYKTSLSSRYLVFLLSAFRLQNVIKDSRVKFMLQVTIKILQKIPAIIETDVDGFFSCLLRV